MTEEQKAIRGGNFTSSDIVVLLSESKRDMTEEELAERKITHPKSKAKTISDWPGTACLTYVSEKRMERRLGRSLDIESNARNLSWGKLGEKMAFQILGIDYRECSEESLVHPTIPYWTGTPDGEYFNEDGTKRVIEVKSPRTMKSFCTLADCRDIQEIREKHDDGEKYYWQVVSNAVLTGAKYGQLIVFCPYFSQLNDIRAVVQQMEGEDLAKCYWISQAFNNELPWVPDVGYYQNLYSFIWEISEEDKALITDRVTRSGEYLFKP